MKHTIAMLLLSLSLSLAGCKPTVEGESSRYTASKDRLEALGTKNPAMKADIKVKLAEFEAAKTAAESKTGEAKANALRELNNRIAAYEATLAPAPSDAGTTPDGPVLGSKLGDGGTTVTPDAAGGKLGAGAGGGSGSGSGSGSAAPVDAGTGSAGSGSNKSGFGPQPDAGTAKSGFGGK